MLSTFIYKMREKEQKERDSELGEQENAEKPS